MTYNVLTSSRPGLSRPGLLFVWKCCMDTVVEAHNLIKSYGSFTAVKGIDFTVRRQECFGFLGPNGAGKTSTMKMIYCRTPVTGGTLTVLGMDVRKHERQVKQRLGVVTQDNDLDPDLTVLDNLKLYGSFFGLSLKRAEEKAEELLEFVQLTAEQRLLLCEFCRP